jgi:hypothetical protein
MHCNRPSGKRPMTDSAQLVDELKYLLQTLTRGILPISVDFLVQTTPARVIGVWKHNNRPRRIGLGEW